MYESSEESKPVDIPQAIWENGEWTPAYFRGLIRGALRRIYFRWPGRKVALAKARVEVPAVKKNGDSKKNPEVWYRCEQCQTLGKAQISKASKDKYVRMWVDHSDPVVPVDRLVNWEEYVDRLFCDPSNFTVLCDTCHRVKSKAENAERRQNVGMVRRSKQTTSGNTDGGAE